MDNFTFEITQVFSSEEEAYLSEEWWISYLKEMEVQTYNIAGGGKGTGSGPNHPMFGKKLPEEWKRKVTAASMISQNRPEIKEAKRQRMVARNWVGENHPMYGKTHTEITKKLISVAGTGRLFSEEHRKNLSEASMGKIVTDETKEKLSKVTTERNLVGERNPNFGNTWSEEQKKNLSDQKKGKPNHTARKFNESDIKEIFDLRKSGMSLTKIAKRLNTVKSVITSIINGKTYVDISSKYRALL